MVELDEVEGSVVSKARGRGEGSGAGAEDPVASLKVGELGERSGSDAESSGPSGPVAAPDPKVPYWTTRDVADLLGVKLETVHRYMADTRYCQELIAKGYELPPEKLAAVMPPPDARFGRTPVWRPATIQEWVRRRPGRGAGGGRPRKNRSSE